MRLASLIVFLLSGIFIFAQKKNRVNFSSEFPENKKDSIDLIIDQVKKVLSDEWYITRVENGFTVSFCRSCHENYLDSLAELDNIPVIEKDFFFRKQGPDSVLYYSIVNRAVVAPNQPGPAESPDGILVIRVDFHHKWSHDKLDSVQKMNDGIKKELMTGPLYKTSPTVFSDYRYYVPDITFKNTATGSSYRFQHLPYSSDWYNYSIFIDPSINCFHCWPKIPANAPDDLYKQEDELNQERIRTLYAIAFALGIKDYKIAD
jgi:hypothetical protein